MDSEKTERIIEIAQTVLLSAVVLVTAWCSYQSSQWSGITSFKLASSQTTGIKATEKALVAEKRFIVDALVVVNFVSATVERNQEIVNFYIQHLRPEFGSLLKAWLATNPIENPDAPPHPIAMPAYTRIAQGYDEETNDLRREQEFLLKDAYEAKRISDGYTFKTVVLASVLFIGGIFPTFKNLIIRLALLVLDYVIALVTFSQLIRMPVAGM